MFDFTNSVHSQAIAVLGVDFNLLDGNFRPLIGPEMAEVDKCISPFSDLLVYKCEKYTYYKIPSLGTPLIYLCLVPAFSSSASSATFCLAGSDFLPAAPDILVLTARDFALTAVNFVLMVSL